MILIIFKNEDEVIQIIKPRISSKKVEKELEDNGFNYQDYYNGIILKNNEYTTLSFY